MMNSILIISGHDFRSPRKANIHFIAQELIKSVSVQFLSEGFSTLSLIKGDPRSELVGTANVATNENGVECFLWKALIHPFNTKIRSLRWLEHAHFKYYRSRLPKQAESWMREAAIVIVESGLGVVSSIWSGKSVPEPASSTMRPTTPRLAALLFCRRNLSA
jgi:2-beta-glucuronyltransferase